MKIRSLPLPIKTALAVLILGAVVWGAASLLRPPQWELCIEEAKTGQVLASAPIAPGDELYFGWVHSLEKIPWDEWYRVTEEGTLMLETISFPAFGAGIPADKGDPVIRDGIIFYENIQQEFPYLQWLNSPQTKDIAINGQFLASGLTLTDDGILILTIKRK